jgi:hypothetical protein
LSFNTLYYIEYDPKSQTLKATKREAKNDVQNHESGRVC